MTLTELADALKEMNPDAALVFATPEADIAGGYHVTELKAARISSIDCGGRRSEWTEAALQLMDGYGGAHMIVGKFVGILDNSLKAVEALRAAPVHVEFAPQNAGLRRCEIKSIGQIADRAEIQLTEATAMCKALRPALTPEQAEPQKTCCA